VASVTKTGYLLPSTGIFDSKDSIEQLKSSREKLKYCHRFIVKINNFTDFEDILNAFPPLIEIPRLHTVLFFWWG